jgi:hypothetical protein
MCQQNGRHRIVQIDHCTAQMRPVKQALFGSPVLVHVCVVVQMVLAEIGEDGGAKLQALQSMLGQADRRGFDGACTHALL